MGEEGKKKKLKYEQPRLVKLVGDAGAGDCDNGSGDRFCTGGNAALDFCDNGTLAAGLPCFLGAGD
ncbi:MAG: hypothetical protein HYW14_01400 [Planctomycetes bacterium]|nr:hypothetical protein [Planctomycetota bacterium]